MKKTIVFLMLCTSFIANAKQGDGGVIKATLDGIDNSKSFVKICKYSVLHKEYTIETWNYKGGPQKWAVLRDSKKNEVDAYPFNLGLTYTNVYLKTKVAKWNDCPNETLFIWNILEKNLREKN